MPEEKTTDVKLSENAKKIMEMVEKMNVLELNDLVKALEEKFGVSASAPMMVAGVGVAGGNGAAAADICRKEYNNDRESCEGNHRQEGRTFSRWSQSARLP